MKSSLILALFISTAAAVKPEWDDDWKAFKSKFGKKYQNSVEETVRRNTWEKTRLEVMNHNQEAAAGKQSYTMTLNTFSDWNATELATLTGAVLAKEQSGVLFKAFEGKLLSRQAPPTSLDLRSDPCMPAVKNQFQCGSCWAFTANTPLEFALCKKSSNLTTLSEQQLVDCAGKFYGNAGCNGGWYTNAWQYVKGAPGQASSASYPYTAKAARCRYQRSMSVGTVASFGNIQRNATAIQLAIATWGPIAVAFQALDSFSRYSSGIYSDSTCPNDVNTVNHGVVLVGYGTSVSGTDYWIVRNSWGATWGQSGYFFIQRGVNMCNIESHAAYVTA